MNVLHIIDENPLNPAGGRGVTVYELSRRQRARGMEVSILCMDFDDSSYRALHNETGEIVFADLSRNGQIFGGLAYQRVLYDGMLKTLAYHFSRREFDMIHVHDTRVYPVADIARHWFKCPVALTSHLSFSIENHAWEGWNEESAFEQQNEIAAMLECETTTVSRAYAAALQEHFPLFRIKPPPRVIHNGVDIEAIDAAAPVDITNLCQNRTPVYFCGRPVAGKGVVHIAEAAKALPDCHFLVFASHAGTKKDAAIEALQNAPPNLTWFKDTPPRRQFGYLKSCKMALVPSINPAPFEITGLEAMAARIPLLTTALCGMSDYCHENNCDIHRPTAEGLIAAIRHHRRRESKLIAARKTAEAMTWEAAEEKYHDFYREILCRTPSTSLPHPLPCRA